MLTDKVVIVSGGAGGIGFTSARFVLEQGGAAVLADAAGITNAQRLSIGAHGHAVLECRCDVTKAAEIEAVIEQAVERFGRIDGVVNCAGVDRHHGFLDLGEDEFASILDVNVLGSFRLAQSAARRMARSPRAHPQSYSVVNMSSVNAVIGTPTHVAYATSKGAIAQMTRVMAVEVAPFGIRVNAVGPGTVRTRMLDHLLAQRPGALDGILARTPMGRTGEASEIAAVVGFLLSDHASYVTGQTVFADRGRTVQNLALKQAEVVTTRCLHLTRRVRQ